MRRGKKVLLSFLSAGIVVLMGFAAAASDNPRVAVLALVGVALGFVLFRWNFGFAGSFRAVLERRDASGFKAQAVALALSSVIFFPLLASGSFLGQPLFGFGSPIGAALLLGGVLFGLGMQIGGGCASGTLFMLGGGDLRLAMTLASFIAGSAIGATHSHLWTTLPSLPATTSQDLLGWPAALSLHLFIFLAIYRLAPGERPSFARPRTRHRSDGAPDRWPLTKGAIWLALLNSLTLVLAGRPWGETAGFTLWGSKIAIFLCQSASKIHPLSASNFGSDAVLVVTDFIPRQ